MLVYWLLLGYFAAGALIVRPGAGKRLAPNMLALGSLLMALAIGLRYQVGADWADYKLMFSYAGFASLGRVIQFGDPGYQILIWSVQRIGGELWVANLICGAIFAWGLHRFARTQPEPWLVFVVAIPYLVVVVAMGYTRQAVAIGILLAGIAAFKRGESVVRFSLYVAVAALFHKTAVLVLPLVILANRRTRTLNLIAGAAVAVLLYDIFLSSAMEGFVRNYIRSEYSSEGAAIRVAMNLVPATCFLLFHRRLNFEPVEQRIWLYFSLASLAMPALLFILPSSTVVDRLAIYLIPLQISVLPRIGYLFGSILLGRLVIISYSALIMYIWLNYATHAEYWIPYKIYPI